MNVLYASCRKFFDNPFFEGSCNLYHDSDGYAMAEPQFVERISGKRVLILVHGYRSETEGPYYRRVLNGIHAWGIEPHYDVIPGYLWPGGSLRVDYPASVIRAHHCAHYLADLTKLLTDHGCTVDVQTHSLGAHVAMDALRSHDAKWRNLFLLAPAIRNDSIRADHDFGKAVASQVQHAYVFYSSGDTVLKEAFPIGESACGDFCADALGLLGAADPSKLPPNAKQIDCSAFIHEHSEYRVSQQFHAEWLKCLDASA